MRCNCFGLRIFTLCLTFWLGILAADQFSAARVQPPEEIKRVIVAHEPKEMNYDSVKPKCKKFFDDFDTEFTNERLTPIEKQTKVEISKEIEDNLDELEARKVEEALKLARERRKKIEDTMKESDRINRESGIAHNLLYIENCAEYY